MDTTAEAVKFECPKGFSKEDVPSQLCFEDVDNDSELWLVRVPKDMDPKDLENQVISMNKNSEILGGSDGKYYECFPEKCVMPNLCLVLPHKEDRTLEEIRKPFKGSLLVTDYVMDVVVKKEEEENEPIEEQQSGDTSLRKKSKSHRSSKENKNKEDLDMSFNLNLEDDDQADSSQTKASKKSKKKKSKDSFKEEPMSDNDEFPNCKSQKK